MLGFQSDWILNLMYNFPIQCPIVLYFLVFAYLTFVPGISNFLFIYTQLTLSSSSQNWGIAYWLILNLKYYNTASRYKIGVPFTYLSHSLSSLRFHVYNILSYSTLCTCRFPFQFHACLCLSIYIGQFLIGVWYSINIVRGSGTFSSLSFLKIQKEKCVACAQ